MKIILIPFVLLMLPIAFFVVAFDVAKTVIEEELIKKLEEKDT